MSCFLVVVLTAVASPEVERKSFSTAVDAVVVTVAPE
ncbi:hypothetical protein A2U01_0090290, partial [Trifolium medium]|nr:hypothetical protein [Trifolium medium]